MGGIVMTQEERRAQILTLLEQAEATLTGSHLSSILGVTRQIIVGVVATPQGYLLYKPQQRTPYRFTVAVRHDGNEETIAHELNLIVDLGGIVRDVTVEHPLYGELTANLQVSSRAQVGQKNAGAPGGAPLGSNRWLSSA